MFNYLDEKLSDLNLYVETQGDKFRPLSHPVVSNILVSTLSDQEKADAILIACNNADESFWYHTSRLRDFIENDENYED